MTMPVSRNRCARATTLVVAGAMLALTSALAARADAPVEDEYLAVVLDQARLVKMPERVATVVVGNPLIADVSIQPGGLMVITGKGYGVTNVVALDRAGSPLMERKVLVKGAYDGTVVVYRGIERETYSCAPFCEPRVTLGDGQQFFGRNLSQTGTWLGQVQGAAQLGRR
ncbi:MAG: pilus assembly protein N-terminal domain-containing protein [Pseudorhodoplanes sp.]|nr:hypothetical protein [Pseudorhodoplanes sp.]MCQ3942157.1 pilus assembly protein CpaC [Alphaproteobacteria bacterium]MCZ7642476.1 pilus assembly protein N-terminal domain-containing protein [Pseudorhodoplanes sp.]